MVGAWSEDASQYNSPSKIEFVGSWYMNGL